MFGNFPSSHRLVRCCAAPESALHIPSGIRGNARKPTLHSRIKLSWHESGERRTSTHLLGLEASSQRAVHIAAEDLAIFKEACCSRPPFENTFGGIPGHSFESY